MTDSVLKCTNYWKYPHFTLKIKVNILLCRICLQLDKQTTSFWKQCWSYIKGRNENVRTWSSVWETDRVCWRINQYSIEHLGNRVLVSTSVPGTSRFHLLYESACDVIYDVKLLRSIEINFGQRYIFYFCIDSIFPIFHSLWLMGGGGGARGKEGAQKSVVIRFTHPV